MKLLFTFLLIILISGCCFWDPIPPGPGPDGPIVSPDFKIDDPSMEQAVNGMISSLTARSISLPAKKGRPLVKEGYTIKNLNDAVPPGKVYASLVRNGFMRPWVGEEEPPEYVLTSSFAVKTDPKTSQKIKVWTMQLVSPDGKEVFWRKTLRLK